MSRIDVAQAYPTGNGFVRGIVKECTNEKIELEDGKIFYFPFPANGLRQRLAAGTMIVVKATASGSAKEYYVIETPRIQHSTVNEVAGVLEAVA